MRWQTLTYKHHDAAFVTSGWEAAEGSGKQVSMVAIAAQQWNEFRGYSGYPGFYEHDEVPALGSKLGLEQGDIGVEALAVLEKHVNSKRLWEAVTRPRTGKKWPGWPECSARARFKVCHRSRQLGERS